MKNYPVDAIRNIALAGHGGTGKTTLIEAMLFNAGVTSRLGKVDDGNTVSDYDVDEVSRKMSLYTTVCPLEWKDTKINLVDTPGFADFIGDVIGAMSAVETALIVVDGSGTVEVGTDNAWEKATEAGIAKIFFINKHDKENMSWSGTIDALRDAYGHEVTPVYIPIGKEAGFSGVVDILNKKAYKYDAARKASAEIDIPADMTDQAEELRAQLIENIAEVDDELTEKYLLEDTLSEEDIAFGFKKGISEGKFYPVLVGSAALNVGIDNLMDFIAAYCPAPKVEEGGLKARVFKTLADPYVGKLTYFKVISGTFSGDSRVYDVNTEKEERVGQVYHVLGKTQTGVSEISTGDIGAVAKLASVQTGDTLGEKTTEALPALNFPEPVYALAVKAANKAAEDKMGPAFAKLMEEDPTFKTYRDNETGQSIVASLGDVHLGITMDKLKRKFGVEVTTETPKVAYRETITITAEAQGKHKKQTGGSGQYGDCTIRMEPMPRGGGYEFVDAIVGGAIPRQYIPAVDKGIQEAMTKGIQAGCQCVDIKITCFDGSYHPVDSKDIAFQMAGKIAFKAAAEKAKPVILEPIMKVRITVPSDCMGDVMGDLNTKRGRVAGMDDAGAGRQIINATVPQNEMLNYCIELRSLSKGRGKFTSEFDHYEEAPMNITQKIIADYEKSKEE